MSLVKIEQKSDVKEVLQDAMEWIDGCDSVIILALTKEGTQVMRTSTMSGMQKAFLFTFFQAWMTKWFRLDSDE